MKKTILALISLFFLRDASAQDSIRKAETIISVVADFRYTGCELEVDAKATFKSATTNIYYMTAFVLEEDLRSSEISSRPIMIHPSPPRAKTSISTALAETPWAVQIDAKSITKDKSFSKLFKLNLDPSWTKENLKFYVAIYKKHAPDKFEIVYVTKAKPSSSLSDVSSTLAKSTQVKEVIIYPNPLEKGDIHINVLMEKSAKMSICVSDLNGRILLSLEDLIFRSGNNNFLIPIRNIPNGIYNVSLIANNQSILSKELIVAK